MLFLTGAVLLAGTLARRPQPTLPTGHGLVLRPWRTEDAPEVHEAFQDPLLHQWHIRRSELESEARGWIDEWFKAWPGEDNAQWAVTDADTDRLLGRAALRSIVLADGCAELAYWTAPWARGQGVASRATAILTRWALDVIGFQRLELLHTVRNEASYRVATKTGFALEGIKRRTFLHPDGWHDMHLHARVQGG